MEFWNEIIVVGGDMQAVRQLMQQRKWVLKLYDYYGYDQTGADVM
jgi:hypothetical protein